MEGRYVPSIKKKGPKPLSRLEVVRALFEAFIDRSEAYDYANEIG